MATKTRALRVKFYNPTTLAERSIPQGYLNAVAGTGKKITSKVGSGSCKIPMDELAKLSGSYTTIQMHDIAVVYNINGAETEEIASFHIRSQKVTGGSYGQPTYVSLSGPDELYAVGKTRHYLNIGKEYTGTVMNHNGQGQSSAGWPFIYLDHGDTDLDTEGMTGVFWPKWTLKKDQSLHTGEVHLKLNNTYETSKAAEDKWAIGDDISIVWQFSPYGQHTTSVINVQTAAEHGEDEYYWVTIADPMTPKKADDNEGGSGPRWYPTFSSTIFKGDPVSIQMQSGLWHTTRIAHDARYNGFYIEEAAPDDILAGANFKWWNSREPNNTNDIALITDNLDGWTLNGTASSKGSFHVVDTKGADILTMLMKTAEATNDYFYTSRGASGPTAPSRTLEWKTSSPFSNLELLDPTSYADASTKLASGTYGMIHSISKISRDLPVSVVVPKGGANDDVNVQWGLGNCTESPAAGLSRLFGISTGVPTMTRTYSNGRWAITNTDAAVSVEEYHEFEDVYPRSTSSNSIIEAANILQARCALMLYNRQTTENVYDVTTVLPDGVEIAPGQTIFLTHNDSEWAVSGLVYIAEYEHFVTNSGKLKGVRQTRMQLSTDGPYPRDTGATAVAKGIKSGISSSGFGVGTGGLGGGNPEEGTPADPPPEISVETSIPSGALTASGMDLSFVLNHGNGLAVSTNNVTLDVPTVNLSATSANAVDVNGHTHAIDSTADPISNPSELVATDANSRTGFAGLGIGQLATADELQLAANMSLIGERTISSTSGSINITPATDLRVDSDIVFVGSQALKTSSGNMFIQPGGDLYLDPSGSFIQTRQDMKAEGFTSGFLGNKWQITDAGDAQFRGIQADELRVKLFSADHTLVSLGSHYVSPGMGEVYDDTADVPSVGNSTTVTFYDDPVIGNAAIFRDGDKGFFRISDSTAGGLYYALVWGTLTNYSDNGDGSQDWTFTTGSLGAAVNGDTIPQGAVFVSWGLSGMGVWSVTTNDLGSGPYAQVQTWTGDNPWTASNRHVKVRLGDLSGVGLQSYGLFAGVNGTSGPRLLMTSAKAELHDIPIVLHQGVGDTSAHVRCYAMEFSSQSESGVHVNGDISAGPAGANLKRSTGTGSWYSHIDNDVDSPGTDYLYTTVNRGLEGASFDIGDLTEGAGPYMVKSLWTQHTTDDYYSVTLQLYDADYGYGNLTDEVEVFNSDMAASGVGCTTERELTNPQTATGAAWAAAHLIMKVYYNVAGGNEVIRIEPRVRPTGSGSYGSGPYIAIGDSPPEAYWVEGAAGYGIWMGRKSSDGTYAMRIGGNSLSTTVPSLTMSTGGIGLWAANDKNNAVIRLDPSGNAYIQNTLALNSSTGKLTAGNLVLNSSGIYQTPTTSSTWDINYAYGFKSGSDWTGGLYGKLNSGNNNMILQTQPITGYESEVLMYARGGSSLDAYIDLSAIENDGSGTAVSLRLDTADDDVVITAGEVYISDDARIEGGLHIGGVGWTAPTDGQLILNQGSVDTAILTCRSTDVTGMTTQGMGHTNNYFQLQKASPDTGGAWMRGAGEQDYAMWIQGSANTLGSSTPSTTTRAPMILRGSVDNATVGAAYPIVAWQNYTATQMVLMGDGQLYNNYATTMTTYDDEDDALLLREFEYAISPDTVLQRSFDQFVDRNGTNLKRLGVMNEHGFVSHQKMTMLKIGAITQHADKLSKLEDLVRDQGKLIDILLAKLGMTNNPGTIIENTA